MKYIKTTLFAATMVATFVAYAVPVDANCWKSCRRNDTVSYCEHKCKV